jgi:hypothetical protein
VNAGRVLEVEGGISKPSSFFDSDIEQTFAGQVGAARLIKAFPRKALSEGLIRFPPEHFMHSGGKVLKIKETF